MASFNECGRFPLKFFCESTAGQEGFPKNLGSCDACGPRTWRRKYVRASLREPRAGKYALRDFTVAIVAQLLKNIAGTHKLNKDTVIKIRSVLSGIFTYAMSEGHFPARSEADNPASRERIPETATEPERTIAATFDQARSILAALKGMPLERAAVGIIAFTGCRPSEARGLRWEEWDRAKQHIAVVRGVWRRVVVTTKTEQSEGFVTVTDELREILLDLWKAQGSPISGYILAGRRSHEPVILDNLAKRSIRTALKRAEVAWPAWYALRRFLGTEVRMKADSETSAKALRNSKAVADKHLHQAHHGIARSAKSGQ